MNKILIIEDDPSMRESMKDLLSLEEWECSLAETGEKGLALMESAQPELVVIDLQLPDMSGYQVCQMLKRNPRWRRLPVVIVSGSFTESIDKIQGFELGADEYFSKPFDPRFFVARIKSLLAQPPSATL